MEKVLHNMLDMKVGAKASRYTVVALAVYSAYDWYDQKHGDHTGRKALIGQ